RRARLVPIQRARRARHARSRQRRRDSGEAPPRTRPGRGRGGQTSGHAGPVVTNVRYTGARIAAGTFSGGTGIVGIESGVVLSSGNIVTVLGPDNSDPNGGLTPNGLTGDPDLDALIPPETCCTHDATVLEFDLECPSGSAI